MCYFGAHSHHGCKSICKLSCFFEGGGRGALVVFNNKLWCFALGNKLHGFMGLGANNVVIYYLLKDAFIYFIVGGILVAII